MPQYYQYLKVHCLTHSGARPDPVLTQMNAVHIPTSYYVRTIQFNVILPQSRVILKHLRLLTCSLNSSAFHEIRIIHCISTQSKTFLNLCEIAAR